MSKKGKTIYQINLKIDQESAKQIIESWLKSNDFKPIEFDGRQIYRGGNIMISCYYFFEYRFENNQLIIEAYLKNPKKPYDLSEGMALIVPASAYTEKLSTLLSALETNQQGAQMQPEQPKNPEQTPTEQAAQTQTSGPQPTATSAETQATQTPTTTNQNTSTAIQSISDKAEKQKATFAEVAFWMSLTTALLSWFLAWGGYICILEFVFAIKGLKSEKRGKAIAAIVFASITATSVVLSIILTILLD